MDAHSDELEYSLNVNGFWEPHGEPSRPAYPESTWEGGADLLESGVEPRAESGEVFPLDSLIPS